MQGKDGKLENGEQREKLERTHDSTMGCCEIEAYSRRAVISVSGDPDSEIPSPKPKAYINTMGYERTGLAKQGGSELICPYLDENMWMVAGRIMNDTLWGSVRGLNL